MLKAIVLMFLLNLPGFVHAQDFVSVCERSPAVRHVLVRLIGKACADITPADLRQIQQLSLSNESVILKPGDLSGLSSLHDLTIVMAADLQIAPGTFQDMHSLANLKISLSGIKVLKKNMFVGLDDLRNLFITDSSVETIEVGAFEGLPHLKALSLRNNFQLTEIKRGVFKNLPWLNTLTFVDCQNLIRIEDEAFIEVPSVFAVTVRGAPLTETKKIAFRGVVVTGLPPGFEVDSSAGGWGGL